MGSLVGLDAAKIEVWSKALRVLGGPLIVTLVGLMALKYGRELGG